jgi:hypothetical protein
MAFIPLTNGVRIAVEYTLNGQAVINVYHVVSENPIVSVNLTALKDIFVAWWTTNLRPQFVPAIALSRIVLKDISEENGVELDWLVSPSVPGTLAGTATPNNVALVIGHKTGLAGRSFRGRTYHAGLAIADVTDNFAPAGRVANIITAYDALETALQGEDFHLVVASFYTNGAPRETAVGTVVQFHTGDLRVDTQRRRLPGVGT